MTKFMGKNYILLNLKTKAFFGFLRTIFNMKIKIGIIVFLFFTNNCCIAQTDLMNKNSKELNSEFSFLNDCKLLNVPLLDSTNFENHSIGKLLTPHQMSLLSLNKIIPQDKLDLEGSRVGINYILHLSDSFISIVYYVYFMEYELSTILANYSYDFELLDFKKITYDENAESMFRTVAYIDKNTLTLTKYMYFNQIKSNKEYFEITPSGKFKAKL